MELNYAAAAARLRAVASRIRLRKRSYFGVASMYSSLVQISIVPCCTCVGNSHRNRDFVTEQNAAFRRFGYSKQWVRRRD
jgi:hypothetical protein